MCGIIGYCGTKQAIPLLMEGLRGMEERGYDAAGLAVITASGLKILRQSDGERGHGISLLAEAADQAELLSTCGMAHTRWATHGEKIVTNAHPHADCASRLAVVHNGIINNHAALRRMLEKKGHTFRSGTDTETIVHLIEQMELDGSDPLNAVREANKLLEGEFAYVITNAREPGRLIAARRGSPLIIGVAEHGLFVASMIEAFHRQTMNIARLEDNDVVDLHADGTYQVYNNGNGAVERKVEEIRVTLEAFEKGDYPTYMLKEINEQPDAVDRAVTGRITRDGLIRIDGLEGTPALQRFLDKELTKVVFLCQGTSMNAAWMIERLFQELELAARVWDGSEFANSPYPFDPGTLFVPISQSGETRDVIEAMEDRPKKRGNWSFTICNKPGSHLTTFGPGMYLHAGPERGVASTKAFTSQVICGSLLGLAIAQYQSRLNTRQVREYYHALRGFQQALGEILAKADEYEAIGAELSGTGEVMYIGRGYNYAIAREGALKMLEITGIHCVSYPAGEMKHGPIALINPNMHVVGICIKDPQQPRIYSKTMDNINQAITNKGRVIVVAESDDQEIEHVEGIERIIRVPSIPKLNSGLLGSLLAVVPLQLMAHGAAVKLGKNPDKPKNLAKSVTVS